MSQPADTAIDAIAPRCTGPDLPHRRTVRAAAQAVHDGPVSSETGDIRPGWAERVAAVPVWSVSRECTGRLGPVVTSGGTLDSERLVPPTAIAPLAAAWLLRPSRPGS